MFDDSDKRDSFRRQRRNLIAASIITAFYEAAEIRIPKINMFGNLVEIGNPDVVSAAITIAFLYFLWRYYTACRETGGHSRFAMESRMWATDQARAYVTRKYCDKQKNKYERADLIKGWRKELTFRLRPKSQNNEEKDVVLRERYWLYQIISFIEVTLRTSTFTEYVLPYILALVAILELLDIRVIEPLISVAMRV